MKRQLRPIHQLYIWDSHVDVGLLRPLMLFKKLVFSAIEEKATIHVYMLGTGTVRMQDSGHVTYLTACHGSH